MGGMCVGLVGMYTLILEPYRLSFQNTLLTIAQGICELGRGIANKAYYSIVIGTISTQGIINFWLLIHTIPHYMTNRIMKRAQLLKIKGVLVAA